MTIRLYESLDPSTWSRTCTCGRGNLGSKACYHGASRRYSVAVLTVTLADLCFRHRQFWIAGVGAGVVLAMAVSISGLASAFKVQIKRTIDAAGADRWLPSSNSDGRITSVATFDAGTVQAVAQTSGVRGANGVTFLPVDLLHSGGTGVTANVMGVGTGPLGKPVAKIRPRTAGSW